MPPRRGIIFILSAPSGAGKTTLSRAAVSAIDGLAQSVSVTTRPPRNGEVDGVDYCFVTDDVFQGRLQRGEFAEWAQVFDARYGTPRAPLDDAVRSGRDVLLDIDVQGARQIRANYPRDAVLIFVLPPTFADLEARLRGRGTESESAIAHRLKRARAEAAAFREYDYLIINRDRDESLERFAMVVQAERLRVSRLGRDFAPWKS